jgi:K+-sensing histidine kinase KdpD
MAGLSKKKRFVIRQIALSVCSALAIFLTIMLTYGNASITNSSTVAFIFLLLIVLTSYFCHLIVEIAICVGAALSFNYFYLSPVGTFTIDALSDWITFIVFLISALFIGYLSTSASEKKSQLRAIRHNEVKLQKLASWMLAGNKNNFSLSEVAQELVKLFNFEYCSIRIMDEGPRRNLIGQAKNGNFCYPGRDFIQTDHSIELNDLIDEFIVDASHVTIKDEAGFFVLFTYKKDDLNAEFLNALSTVISVRIKDWIAHTS